jgi:hypothetical protein
MRRRVFLNATAWMALAVTFPASWLAARSLPPVRRYGRHYLVNGWLVTAKDLEVLRRHAP